MLHQLTLSAMALLAILKVPVCAAKKTLLFGQKTTDLMAI
jgi:hypothetical protein